MNLVKIGRRTLNLDYLIEATDDEPAQGCVRLYMMEGRELVLVGDEAAQFNAALAMARSRYRYAQGRRPGNRPRKTK